MKVFLSYPSERLAEARWVYDFLRSMDVEIWFDKESLIGGQDWERERRRAQKEANLTLLIWSAETEGRAGVIQREVRDAIALLQDQPPGHIYLVVLRAQEIKLSAELDRYQYVDLFKAGWKFELARSIKLRLAQLKEAATAALSAFIVARENANNVETRTIGERTARWDLEADYFVFRTGGNYWNYVNAEITSAVFNEYFLAKGESKFAVTERNVSWSLKLEDYFASDELVSLKFFNYLDVGGAHPTRGVFTRNFGGSTIGRIELKELFGYRHDVLKFLKEYSELDVNRQLVGTESAAGYERDWAVFSQWGFNEEALSINLSQYSELPFVAGVFEVKIPWDKLADKVAEQFRDTSIGIFIANRARPIDRNKCS